MYFFVLLTLFFSAFYQIPYTTINATFISIALLPIWFIVCYYRKTPINRDFISVGYLFFYLVIISCLYGWEGGTNSLVNILFYFSTFFILKVLLKNYSFLKCFFVFYTGSLVFYTYELILRIANVISNPLQGASGFYTFKLNGEIFNDTNYIAVNLLFLFISFDCFWRTSKHCSKFVISRSSYIFCQSFLFVLVFLTFSRAAILLVVTYVFYSLFKWVNVYVKILMFAFSLSLLSYLMTYISSDESFMNRFEILYAFQDFVINMEIRELVFGFGVLSWSTIYNILGLNINHYQFVGHLFFFQMLAFGGLIYFLLFFIVSISHTKSQAGRILILFYFLLGLSYIELFSYMFWGTLAFASVYGSVLKERVSCRRGPVT